MQSVVFSPAFVILVVSINHSDTTALFPPVSNQENVASFRLVEGVLNVPSRSAGIDMIAVSEVGPMILSLVVDVRADLKTALGADGQITG